MAALRTFARANMSFANFQCESKIRTLRQFGRIVFARHPNTSCFEKPQARKGAWR